MSRHKDAGEQLSFDFFDDLAETPKDKVHFESEDELLDIMTSAPEEDSVETDLSVDLSPAEACECLSAGASFSESGADVPQVAVVSSGVENGDSMSLETVEDAERVIESLAEPVAADDVPFEKVELKSEVKAKERPPLTEKTLMRAAMAFLASLHADSCATRVSTDLPRFRVGAGAFTLCAGRRSPVVHCTMLAEVALDRAECIPSPGKRERIVCELEAEKVIRESLEAELRVNEPELCDGALFPETAVWNYSLTKNRKYHSCLKRMEKLAFQLEHSTLLESILSGQKVTEYYLVTPSGLVSADEIPSAWGLVYVNDDLSFRLVREAEVNDCTQEELTSFALRVSAASASDILFANGISVSDTGSIDFRPVPKRRRGKH